MIAFFLQKKTPQNKQIKQANKHKNQNPHHVHRIKHWVHSLCFTCQARVPWKTALQESKTELQRNVS